MTRCGALLWIGLLLAGAAGAQTPPIRLIVNASEVATERTEGGVKVSTPPRLVEGRLYLPVRATYEALGATLGWEDERKTLVVTVPGHKVEFPTGARSMVVDGEETDMGEAPKVLDGSMYLGESVLQRTLPLEVRYDREDGRAEVTYRWEKQKVRLEDLAGWPRFFVGKELILEGEYRGWQTKGIEGPAGEGPPPPPPPAPGLPGADGRRGDWVLGQEGLGVYIAKRRPKGLHPLDDVGVAVRVEGVGAVWTKKVPAARKGDPATILTLPYVKAETAERM